MKLVKLVWTHTGKDRHEAELYLLDPDFTPTSYREERLKKYVEHYSKNGIVCFTHDEMAFVGIETNKIIEMEVISDENSKPTRLSDFDGTPDRSPEEPP